MLKNTCYIISNFRNICSILGRHKKINSLLSLTENITNSPITVNFNSQENGKQENSLKLYRMLYQCRVIETRHNKTYQQIQSKEFNT